VQWCVLAPSPLGYSIETGEGERFGSGQARQRERLSHCPTPGEVTGKGHVDHAWPIELGDLDAAQQVRSTAGLRKFGHAVWSVLKQRSCQFPTGGLARRAWSARK